ncbi:minor capsid protein [Listeria booriae]|uniref:minor capsid protein n=1 Tax=Listeria booriae TaxID=1552123 RepID=UPI001628EFA9|nr:minor capsid protein [Listeria booriae]MBC2303379.1 minor capsid protein [Listeria booriae]
MPVKMNIDLSGVANKIKIATKEGQVTFAKQVHADMLPYVPFLAGELSDNSLVSDDGKEIIFISKYARRQYYGVYFNFTLTHHPLAGAMWDTRAKADNMNKWLKTAENAIKEGL